MTAHFSRTIVTWVANRARPNKADLNVADGEEKQHVCNKRRKKYENSV